MEYIALIALSLGFIGLILFIKNRFLNKTYPEKTEKLLNSVLELDEIGLKKNDSGFNGHYRNYFISVFATTSMKSYGPMGGDKFQVWVSTAPEKGQLKKLGGFFGKFMVSGESNGFAYVGFLVNAKATNNAKQSIIDQLNELISLLENQQVKPFEVKLS